MVQIIFNEISAAEMAQMPASLQLEIMSEMQVLPDDFEVHYDKSKFGRIEREGEVYYRFRAKEYRIYFQKADQGIRVQRILHKNTLKDFLFRAKLPMGEDEELQKNPGFWKLLTETSARTEKR